MIGTSHSTFYSLHVYTGATKSTSEPLSLQFATRN